MYKCIRTVKIYWGFNGSTMVYLHGLLGLVNPSLLWEPHCQSIGNIRKPVHLASAEVAGMPPDLSQNKSGVHAEVAGSGCTHPFIRGSFATCSPIHTLSSNV